jgi:hypothetical protein
MVCNAVRGLVHLAWAVDFQGGYPISRDISGSTFVRCVR